LHPGGRPPAKSGITYRSLVPLPGHILWYKIYLIDYFA
jgi:hypothetical protein